MKTEAKRKRPGVHGTPLSVRIPNDLQAKIADKAQRDVATITQTTARILDLGLLVEGVPGLLDLVVACSGGDGSVVKHLLTRGSPDREEQWLRWQTLRIALERLRPDPPLPNDEV